MSRKRNSRKTGVSGETREQERRVETHLNSRNNDDGTKDLLLQQDISLHHITHNANSNLPSLPVDFSSTNDPALGRVEESVDSIDLSRSWESTVRRAAHLSIGVPLLDGLEGRVNVGLLSGPGRARTRAGRGRVRTPRSTERRARGSDSRRDENVVTRHASL